MKIDSSVIQMLACPRCKGDLSALECARCGLTFPIVQDIPILINDENSLFSTESFVEQPNTTRRTSSNWKQKLKSLIPSITLNVRTRHAFEKFFANLSGESSKVLIIGGAVTGVGLDLNKVPQGTILVESDVAFGKRTNLICDAHDLPFKNGTFDGVVAQAVLEHVLEPSRCVSEIERVLKKDGTVYAETPFMQQVHAGAYDFTRFTHLGHRRLFRAFDELESGVACGPGTALAWSCCYFLQSFFSNRTMQQVAFGFGSLCLFWLKYFDYFLAEKPGSFDSASAYYFWGRKSVTILDDKKLIEGYKGAIQ